MHESDESRLAPTEAELVESLADLALVGLAADGTVGSWNAASSALFGLGIAQASGRPFAQLGLVVDDHGVPFENLLRIAAEQGRLDQTLDYRRPDGSTWRGHTVINAVRAPDGALRGFAHVTRRVLRPAVEGTAPADTRILRLLVEGVQDYAIFSLDPTGRIQSWNKGAQQIKGYAAAEIVGRHFSVFYRPEDVERGWPAEELSRAAERGHYEDEGWRVRKDGTLIWANVILTAIRDADGALLGFSKVTRDLTARRRQEELQAQREEDFRILVEGVHGHAMFLVDPDGRIRTWNAGARRLLGYEAAQVIGQPTTVLYNEADRHSAQFALALNSAREQGHIQFRAWRQRADGTPIWVEVSSTALRNADGSPRGFVQVIRDLTEATRVEELESEGRRTAKFIAMLSHELRNPLAPIRNAATLLKRFASNPETAAWCADIVDRQVTHMTRLVDDLLDVSRVTNGKIRIQAEPCDLRQIVLEAVESLRPMVHARGHRLAIDLPDAPVAMMGDATRLTQVVVNLLTNAAKYTLDAGTVSVELSAREGWATLAVGDTGVGMSAALVERAFEPFVQGEQTLARSEGGLGVGLTLVKSVVHLHGGTVSATSAGEGQGTLFSVRLPLEPAAVVPGAAEADPPERPRALKVLVVDDNTDAADAVAMMLRLEGHEVEVAYDGLRALETAMRQRPEVAVLDIGLPGINGYELAQRLHRTSGLEQVKLIALTGYGQQQDIAAARAAGFAHHLTKPAVAGELARLVVA